MSRPLQLHHDRLFSADLNQRACARELYQTVKNLPIISPHGHTDPQWFADNAPFSNPTDLLIRPDHYVVRMLYSLGVPIQAFGLDRLDGQGDKVDPAAIWRTFAKYYYAFRGTPSRMWLDYVFKEVFHLDVALDETTADHYYQHINDCLQQAQFLPRALFEQFNIEVITTTESPLDTLKHHQTILDSGWQGKVVTAYRSDPVVDPDYEKFSDNLNQLAELTGEDTRNYRGYLNALKIRRDFFKSMGATSTDHGHPTAFTADLSKAEATALFDRVKMGNASMVDAELFRGQMLMEMALMSLDDGLVMQIHPGAIRNHNPWLFSHYGRDKGADIPSTTNYVNGLKPLLDKVGNEIGLTIILFTLDETTYSRELAPLAGHYPVLKLGPPWWFHDSPEGMRRFRQQTTETAGFYNTVGFNDDTRAFLSIPARHDVARRMDCAFLAELVADHRLHIDEAQEIAHDLAYNLAKKAYKL